MLPRKVVNATLGGWWCYQERTPVLPPVAPVLQEEGGAATAEARCYPGTAALLRGHDGNATTAKARCCQGTTIMLPGHDGATRSRQAATTTRTVMSVLGVVLLPRARSRAAMVLLPRTHCFASTGVRRCFHGRGGAAMALLPRARRRCHGVASTGARRCCYGVASRAHEVATIDADAVTGFSGDTLGGVLGRRPWLEGERCWRAQDGGDRAAKSDAQRGHRAPGASVQEKQLTSRASLCRMGIFFLWCWVVHVGWMGSNRSSGRA